jgi:hypothetical protein
MENYKHWLGGVVNINFKKYAANIKKYTIEYFNDYKFDIYLSTNDITKDELIKTYNPVDIYIDNDNNHNRIYKTIKGLELIIKNIETNNINYKFIIITRFDIYFLKCFSSIDFNKLNIISILEHKHIDDNFHFIPIHYLHKFYNLLLKEATRTNYDSHLLHYLIHKFHDNFDVNYLYNEYKAVENLSFFKLRYFENIDFKINKYVFSENVTYTSLENNSTMTIIDNIIHLNKIINNPNPTPWCWIGYDIADVGYYNLIFEMKSDKDLIDFDFIKTHYPITFYKTQHIFSNAWTQITQELTISEENDQLFLIFDEFPQAINVQFKNLKIEKAPSTILPYNII